MKVLIVVDAQKDFIDGALGSAEAQAAIPALQDRITAALEEGTLVIFTQDTHTVDYMNTLEGKNLPVPHCIYGTPGWDVDERVDIIGAPHIQKLTFGCYDLVDEIERVVQDFDPYLTFEDLESIEFCGFCTDICVISNALLVQSIAHVAGIEVIVDSKACAGVTPEKHKAAIEVMKSCQITIRED